CSSHPSTSINVIKAYFNDAIIKPQQTKEPEPTLDDEFKDLHLNLPVLEVLAHAPIYNAILDKYVESLELGKNGSTFVQGETLVKMGDPGPFTLPCRLGDSEPFDTLADLGSCVNIIPLYLFKKLNIELLEETDHIFGLADGTKSYPVEIVKDVVVHIGKLKLLNDFYILDMKKDPETPLLIGRGFLATANAVIDCKMAKICVGEGIIKSIFSVKGIDLDFIDCHLPGEWEISRDAELNPFKDTLVFRRMVEFLGAITINLKCNMWESKDLIEKPIDWSKPPKNEDGAWHAKIRIIDPDGEKFTKTFQSIPTTRKLSVKESPKEIINLDHFYDTFVSCSFGWPENNTNDHYLVGHERFPLGLRLDLSFYPLVYESVSSGIQSLGNLKISGNEDHHRQGRRFAAGGNGHDRRDPREVEIERLRQRVRELEINLFDRYGRQYEDTPTDTAVEEYENEGSEFEKNSPASSVPADPSPTTPSAIPGTTTD
nr:hypothetical protein [Tanacetum cinerariifolium]